MGRLPGWAILDLVSPTVMRPRQSSVSSVGEPSGWNLPFRKPVLGWATQLPLCHQPNLQWSLPAMYGRSLFSGWNNSALPSTRREPCGTGPRSSPCEWKYIQHSLLKVVNADELSRESLQEPEHQTKYKLCQFQFTDLWDVTSGACSVWLGAPRNLPYKICVLLWLLFFFLFGFFGLFCCVFCWFFSVSLHGDGL